MAIVKQRGWESSLGVNVGAAGISTAKPGTIKCLHAHFAHYLATGHNTVGNWVQQELDSHRQSCQATKTTPHGSDA